MKIIFISLLILVASQCCLGNSMLHADGDSNLYHRPSNFCGIVSLYYALNEIKHKVSLDDLMMNITTEETGASLGEMCRYLDKCDVEYRVVMDKKIEKLIGLIKPHKRVLIVHADQGSHYFTVKVNKWGELYILDGGQAILDAQAEVIKQRYSNVAVIIGEEAIEATFLLDKKVRLAFLAIAFTIGLLIGSLWVKNTNNLDWRFKMRKCILIICLIAFTGVLFAGASFNGVSTCISSDVEGVIGSANDKKCKSEDPCDGTNSCTGDADGVDCGEKGASSWGCETASTKCCNPGTSSTRWGTKYDCQGEVCTAGSGSTADCGSHPATCANH